MAHLNLVMVHPFKDGNGRMARTLQSLVIAREGALAPVFMSVEEYLGRNTQAYYDVLAAVGGGAWHPERDARPWLRFMLVAHLRQATTMATRITEAERLWVSLEQVAQRQGLPDRALVALFDAALGLRIRNATYRAALHAQGEAISDHVAASDLKRLVAAELLTARGEKRGRHYVASARLTALHSDVRSKLARDTSDPFAG